jgi:hypothetical protein
MAMADGRHSLSRLSFAGVVPGGFLQMVVLDLACPYMAYQLLLNRLSWLPALLLAALFPLVGIGIVAIRQHMLDLPGILALYVLTCVLANNLLSVPLSPFGITIPIAIVGLVVLATHWLSRPLLFYVDHYYHTISHPDQGALYDQYWQTQASYRTTIMQINQVCGWGQIIAALVLSALFYLLPQKQNIYLFLLPFITTICYLALALWAIQYRTTHEPAWAHTDQTDG